MARLLRVDSEKLKRLRIKGGWPEPDDFAVAANVSLQTVLRAESNGRNYARNIKKFAEALRLKDWRELLEPPNVQNGLLTVEFVLDLSKAEAGALSSLVQRMEELVEFRNDIKGLRVKYGSVILYLKCHEDDVPRLVVALAESQLTPLRVRSIRLHIPKSLYPLPPNILRDFIHSSRYLEWTSNLPMWLVGINWLVAYYDSRHLLSTKLSGRLLSIRLRSTKDAPTSSLPTP